MNKSFGWLYLVVLVVLPSTVSAAVIENTMDFEHNGNKYKGYIYHDDAVSGKRPGVMVVHQWWGLTDYAKDRARQLAEMGYVSFAMDMYGENKVTTHPEQAKEWMTQTTSNADAWRALANKGLDLLKSNDKVDTAKVAAIGYCFGGSTVMQLAYSGADVAGVVSFHGSLPPASPEQAKAIKGKVLVEHGNADTFVPAERIAKFKDAQDKLASGQCAEADLDMRVIAKMVFVLVLGLNHDFSPYKNDLRSNRCLQRLFLCFL